MSIDSAACERAGAHSSTARHTAAECTLNTTFDDIATVQGWNADSRESVLKDFISTHPKGGDLVAYAQARADEENAGSEFAEPTSVPLPDLQMDVAGKYYGNAYPETREFRVRLTVNPSATIVMHVEDNGGYPVVDEVTISEEEVDGIQKVGGTDHSLSGYEDDWTIPVGIERTVHWEVGDGAEISVRLNEAQITEVAAWLTYAVGEETWDGGEEWEF